MVKKREKIPSVYINKGYISYWKGYFGYVFNKDDSKDSNNIVIAIKIFAIMVAAIFLTYLTKVCLDNFTTMFIIEKKYKPDFFNEDVGDYCTKDDKGLIVKCFCHSTNFEKWILTVLFLMLLGIFTFLIVMLTILIFIPCISGLTQSISSTFSKYNKYRKQVEEKVKKDIVEIV